MSATLAPGILSSDNPIDEADVYEAFGSLGLKPKPDDVGDLTSLLKGMWEVWDRIGKMDDYVPVVDEDRYPRVNIHRPEGEENQWNAWAWKATVKDVKGSGGELRLLEGRTVCLKDTIALKGVPCLLGTDVFTDWIPNTDATIATRILEAGGIIVGKSVCENLSLWGVSNSSATGPISNVFAEGYSAGGSSSGTGVLIGRGEVDFGVGGDQGGSIRIPAAKNGIVGLKPTFGLVPYTGIAGLEPTIDHVGPMTKTVLDNALFLRVMAGVDGIDDRQGAGCPFPAQVPDYPSLAKKGIKGLKVGIIKESLSQPLYDPNVSKLLLRAASEFGKLGAIVDEISIPLHLEAPNLWATIGRLSGTRAMLGTDSGRRGLRLNDLVEKMSPLTQDMSEKMFVSSINSIKDGLWAEKNLPPTLLGKATNLVRKLRDTYQESLDRYDVLITPALVYLPKKLPPRDASISQLMDNSNGVSLNTSAFNLTGFPALSLPIGLLPDADGVKLPVGMQIVGNMFDEAMIYRFAYAWEQAFKWEQYV